MQNRLSFIMVLLTLLLGSCGLYTSQEEKLLTGVSSSIFEEQRKISENIVLNKNKFRTEVADNGNKPSDKKVEERFLKLYRQMNYIFKQLDTLIQKNVEEKQLVQLEDSIKALEAFALSMKKQNLYLEKTELPSKVLNEYFPTLKKRSDLNSLRGKLYLLVLRNKLLMWEENMAEEFYAQVGSSCSWNWTPIFALVEPESETVEEGSEYKANLFWATSVYAKGKLEMEDTLATTNPFTGYSFNFKVTPGSYNEKGLCKKQWKATYTYMNYRTNEDTSLVITRDYYVKKPCK